MAITLPSLLVETEEPARSFGVPNKSDPSCVITCIWHSDEETKIAKTSNHMFTYLQDPLDVKIAVKIFFSVIFALKTVTTRPFVPYPGSIQYAVSIDYAINTNKWNLSIYRAVSSRSSHQQRPHSQASSPIFFSCFVVETHDIHRTHVPCTLKRKGLTT